ncbi:hypothetical protein B0A52_04025 [Exophiala mesophila]|uniref:White collar 2 protein n=1 Tax=Exophiala mesophila TaxID=212818 RepID=A0A438NA35_EXOME|nr:hypothetical protein B0A52_04025 [Exophiala mesophila]
MMDSFRNGAESMADSYNVQSQIFDPSVAANLDLSTYADNMAMDLSNLPAATFEGLVPDITPTLVKEPSSLSESTTPNPTIGAGPLPTGFAQNSQSTGTSSTLTEFTKRRNWSQRVLDELKDLLYILTADGRVLYMSPSSKTLIGYEATDILGSPISDYLHPDDSSLFIREFNESIASGNPLRFFHRLRTAEEKYRIFECHGHPHLTSDVQRVEQGLPVPPAPFCRGFFMMARPYPTKNSEMLDSFLEHKLENVRLQARIAALKREEEEDAEIQQEAFHKQAGANGHRTPSGSAEITARSPSAGGKSENVDYNAMPPPAKPTSSNVALTREALDEANAHARPDSIRDKMARYEGSSHVDSIEMFTGLRYREGERSHGISTGGTSPALIRGDAGIHIPIDKADARFGGSTYSDKKPKKVKSADEFVCTDCGTLDSPEWRKGPNGPKTLCNACGLRWAKKEKKRGGSGTDLNDINSGGAS